VTYYQWISRGLAIYEDIPWLGLRPLRETATADGTRGSEVFRQKCEACHGSDGHGTKIAPPLWGPDSFNDGAGTSHPKMFSAFSHLNMPFGNPDLTEEQAWDVAAFVTGQPRPHFVRR
jgi:thiosulfate dehydrogenase